MWTVILGCLGVATGATAATDAEWTTNKLTLMPLSVDLPGAWKEDETETPADAGPFLKKASFFSFVDIETSLHATIAVAEAEPGIDVDVEMLELAAQGIGDAIEADSEKGFEMTKPTRGTFGKFPAVQTELRYTLGGLDFQANVVCIASGAKWLVLSVGWERSDQDAKSLSRRALGSIRYGGEKWRPVPAKASPTGPGTSDTDALAFR